MKAPFPDAPARSAPARALSELPFVKFENSHYSINIKEKWLKANSIE
jgi:hypothetical protein